MPGMLDGRVTAFYGAGSQFYAPAAGPVERINYAS